MCSLDAYTFVKTSLQRSKSTANHIPVHPCHRPIAHSCSMHYPYALTITCSRFTEDTHYITPHQKSNSIGTLFCTSFPMSFIQA